MKRLLLSIAALALWAAALPCSRAQAARSDYKIAPHDILIIDVFGEKDFSREFRVSATGTINYFYVGEITVGGKTTSQVREELTKMLDADYLVEPQVAVDVKQFRSREVFVNGQVNKPGAIPLTGDEELTIMTALARAGGLTARASSNKIKFSRLGERERVFSFDELKDKKNWFPLEPGDIIEVGDKLL